MQAVFGYVLIVSGLLLILLGVLVWLGVVKQPVRGDKNVWDLLLEVLKQAPWVVVVGLILIYVGCKMIGVPLPP